MRYDDYFELSEKNTWRVTDLEWKALEADSAAGRISNFDRAALQGTAVIESGVPHYADVWNRVEHLHDDWDLWQFTTLWTGEESRHAYALKKACDLLGITPAIEADLDAVVHFPFAEKQKESCPSDCYSTIPGMLTYALIQELATHQFYTLAAKRVASPVLKQLFSSIAADEMRHHVFFRDALRTRWEASTDREAFSAQVLSATESFKMPHLIYGLQRTLFDQDYDISSAMMTQLGRCFSFDPELLRQLAMRHLSQKAA